MRALVLDRAEPGIEPIAERALLVLFVSGLRVALGGERAEVSGSVTDPVANPLVVVDRRTDTLVDIELSQLTLE